MAEGFLNYRVFRRLRSLPWILERGNIAENICILREGSEPADPVSQNLEISLPRLSREAAGGRHFFAHPCAMEQSKRAMVSLPRSKKLHKEYKSSTLTARAMVASMQPLVS